MNQKGNPVVWVLVAVVAVVAVWFAYNQGYLGGAKDNTQDIEINLPGGSPKSGY